MAGNIENIAVKYTDINEMEKVKRIKEELMDSSSYISSCIYPQLSRLPYDIVDSHLLYNSAKGCCLIHNHVVQKYTVIKHYYCEGEGDIFAVAETERHIYGFLVDSNGLARLGNFHKSEWQGYLSEVPTYVGKTFAEITHEFNIPYAEQIPLIYKPEALHKVIERILHASENYLKNNIFPKFTGVSKDSEEWFLLTDSCQGSILAHHPRIDFPILEHYRRGNYLDFLVVDRGDADTVYCFVLDSGYKVPLLRYHMYSSNGFKGQEAKKFAGKSLKAVLDKYNIPLVCELPDLFN